MSDVFKVIIETEGKQALVGFTLDIGKARRMQQKAYLEMRPKERLTNKVRIMNTRTRTWVL